MYKQQHICEECGSNFGSLKAKRRHFTIKHQAQLLVHNCGDCGQRYQTRNSLARHVNKKKKSSKGMKRPTRRPQPADFKMALGGGLKYKQQHICEECGSNSSPKTKRRHLTIEHQAQLLVHNCRDCGKRYQTRNSLARHVDKKYMSSKGMTRPALETTIEQESLLPVKKPDTPPETENTTKHVSHSPVYTNNGETVYSEQQLLTVPNMMNRPLPTTDCDTLDDSFNLSEFQTTDPTIASLLPNNVLAELSESQIRLPTIQQINTASTTAYLPADQVINALSNFRHWTCSHLCQYLQWHEP